MPSASEYEGNTQGEEWAVRVQPLVTLQSAVPKSAEIKLFGGFCRVQGIKNLTAHRISSGKAARCDEVLNLAVQLAANSDNH